MMFFLPERGLRIRETDTRCQHQCSTHFQSWFWSWWSSLQFILGTSHCILFPRVRTRDGWVGSANATSVAGWIIIDLTGPMARSFFLVPELCRQVTWHWAISNFQSTNKSSFLFVLVSFRASDQYFTASAIIFPNAAHIKPHLASCAPRCSAKNPNFQIKSAVLYHLKDALLSRKKGNKPSVWRDSNAQPFVHQTCALLLCCCSGNT